MRWARPGPEPQTSRTATISSNTAPYRPVRNAPRSITMSISPAPASTASAVSTSFTSREDRPDGNAVATAATATDERPADDLPADDLPRASTATGTRSG